MRTFSANFIPQGPRSGNPGDLSGEGPLHQFEVSSTPPLGGEFFLILENGSHLLLEDGNKTLLEKST